MRPQAIDSANEKESAILAFKSSAKDWPSCGLYMMFSSEQMAQVARYAMESKNKRLIAKLSSSGPSISRKVQSGGRSQNMRIYCESYWSDISTKCGQIVARSPTALWGELDHRLDKCSHPPLQKHKISKHKCKLSIHKSLNENHEILDFQRNRKIFFHEIFPLYSNNSYKDTKIQMQCIK